MKMNQSKRKELALEMENIDQEMKLTTKDRELIGMAQEAEIRGDSLRSVVGDDERSFSDELIRALLGTKLPEGKKIEEIMTFSCSDSIMAEEEV